MNVGQLVGLVGRKRSGKDSVALIMIEQKWLRAAFADTVRQVALAIDPVVMLGPSLDTVRTFDRLAMVVARDGWDNAKVNHADIRRFLQRLGTEGVREILGQDLWVDHTMDEEVIPNLNAGDNVVITDVRFPNEIDAVRAAGGEIWRIDRPGLGPDTDTHASEMAWRRVQPDVIITNDGDLAELADKVRRQLQRDRLAA